MELELFRINVLAIRKHNDVFTASSDRKVTLFIDEAEIAGVKPPISYRFAGFFRVAIVTLHQNRPADQHFAHAFIVWIVDSNGHAPNRFADGTETVIVGRRDRGGG